MIKKLRRRFILAAMLAILLVLETMIGVICGVNYSRMRSRADSLTQMIADGGGQLMPTEPGEDAELGEEAESGDMPTIPVEEDVDSETGDEAESKEGKNTDSEMVSSEDTTEDVQNSKANSNQNATDANGKSASDQSATEKTDTETMDTDTPVAGETPPDAPDGDDGKLFLNQNKNLFTEETPYETRYFTVTVDEDGTVVSSDLQMVASVTEDEAEEYALEVLDSQKTTGFYENYRYRVVETDDGTMYIFLDCRQEIATVRSFVLTSFGVSTLGLVAVFVLVVLFSKVVFRPVAESYKKQRQFITDASHELKTPLTIIDANTEVIEMESGESAWTQSIRRQVKRLSTMTQQLITLSKMDEAEGFSEKAEFSLSDAAAECVQTFGAAALRQEKTFDLQLEEGISYVGNEKSLRQMMDILFENAVKYSLPGTTICVTLARRNGKIFLETKDETEEIPQGDLRQIFERFYRLDSARNSEKGGSGIGLSVAQAIVQAHKGKISAYSADGKSLKITVVL